MNMNKSPNMPRRRMPPPHREVGWEKVANEIRELGPHVQPPIPNPAPLGLFAFGLTTALLQVKHTQLTDDGKGVENLTWGYAIFYGGLLQVIAGIVEIKRNNIFGFTAFTSYGGFWLSLGTAHIVATLAGDGAVTFSPEAVKAMLSLMGFFTFVMWICTFKMNATISLLFFSLASTFFLLAGGVGNESVDEAAGWFGMFTAGVAYWLGAAEIINDILGGGKTLIPLGSFKTNAFQSSGGAHVPGQVHGVAHRQVLKDTKVGEKIRRSSVYPLQVPPKELAKLRAADEHGHEHEISHHSDTEPDLEAGVQEKE